MKVPVRFRPAICAGAVFAVTLAGFLWLYLRSPLLYDTDAYYHLTVARAQAAEGVDHDFPWTRFGILSRAFGDKELLFHLALAPFASSGETGGAVALAIFDAGILAAIAWIAAHALGAWGAVVPLWLWLGSSELVWRMVRLRPELLSLLLLLAALWAAAHRRFRWLGVLAALYALSYVAIHAFVGLLALLFLAWGWGERRWEWRLLLYPVLGAGLGMLVHPQFPANLTVIWFHAVEFFRFKGTLDVGTEIRANLTDVTLLANLGWWLGLGILWRSAEPVAGGDDRPPEAGRAASRRATAFGVAAAVFGLLYLLMSRFSIYAVPFATLWLLFELGRRGLRIGRRVRLLGDRSMPLWVAALAALLVMLPIAARELDRYLERNRPGPGAERLVDRRQWSAALPAGARVAAAWRDTALYMYYAPQGRYLNVLDPGLLAYSDPEVHEIQRRVFAGEEPDVPLRVVADLESDYLGYSLVTGDDRLTARLEHDPRVIPVHRGIHGLFRICRDCSASFVDDWRARPGSGPAGDPAAWIEYPLRTDEGGRVEGFVDASRLAVEGCATFRHVESLEAAESRLYELAPWGPASLSVDGRPRARLPHGVEAVLGHGVVMPLDLEAGEHLFEVTTCPAAPGGPSGFYLLRRG